MADHSNIEWTDASWTPIRARNRKTGKVGWYCEHATTGCINCYSEAMNKRLGTGLPFKPGHRADVDIFLDEKMLLAPLRWKKPRMIFVCSMTDLFADFVPDEWIDKMFAVMALCPQHTFQVLTKRAERMLEYFTAPHPAPNVDAWHARVCTAIDTVIPQRSAESINAKINITKLAPLPNVWLGTSCERQEEADERIPYLLQTPAAVRFVSAEPLLGPTDLTNYFVETASSNWDWYLDWIIVGGESGKDARPMHPEWARAIRDQCAAAGVPFFFKQWGEYAPPHWPIEPATHAIFPSGHCYRAELGITAPAAVERELEHESGGYTRISRYGKKAAGRLLDGREHNDMPKVRA